MAVALADLIDWESLLGLAGARSYERDLEYLEWGAIERIERSGEGVAAWVQGGGALSRAVLLWDRNWVVVSQDPPAGAEVDEDTTITPSAKKEGE